MNANSFESLTMTNGGATVFRILFKQIKSAIANAKWASDVHNSKPEMIRFNFDCTFGSPHNPEFTEILVKQSENASPAHDAAKTERIQIQFDENVFANAFGQRRFLLCRWFHAVVNIAPGQCEQQVP